MSSYRTVNTVVTAKSLLEIYRPKLNTVAYPLDATLPGGTPNPPYRNSDNNITSDIVHSLRGANAPNAVDNSNNGAAGTFSNGTKRTIDISLITRAAFAYTGYGGTGSIDTSVITSVHY